MAMELSDDIMIQAPRAAVYAALNDIAILQKCIPGCEELERVTMKREPEPSPVALFHQPRSVSRWIAPLFRSSA